MKINASNAAPPASSPRGEPTPARANEVSNEGFVNSFWEAAASQVADKHARLPIELLIAESFGIKMDTVAQLPSKEEIEALLEEGKKVLFSENAIREALSLGNKEEEFETREHVQGTVFSIDDYASKDLDNALSFRVNEEGSPLWACMR